MHSLIRVASLELQLANNKEVVKVAGILNKLKNYLKQLSDKEYASAVDTLRSDAWMLQQVANQLRKKIKELTEAIDEGDVASYDLVLDEVRSLTSDLAIELKELNQDAQESNPRERQQNQPIQQTDLTQQSAQQAQQTQSIAVDSDKYTREEWDNQSKRAAIFDYTARMIKQWHPDHDVPIEKNINKPVHSFKWFQDKDVHIKEGNENGAKDRLIYQTAMLLKRETRLSYEEVEATFSNSTVFNELSRRLVNAIYNGTLIDYAPAAPTKEPKDKSKSWVKERQIGEIAVKIKTADFIIPVYDISADMTVGLIDMSVPLNGTNKLVLGFTEYSRVLSGGVPQVLRKDHQPKLPEIIAPEPEPDSEPVTIPVEKPAAEGPAEAPIKQKIVRKRKVSTLRMELFKGLIKKAGVDPNAAKKLPDSFWVKFVDMSDRLGAKPEDLAQVIYSESAFDPHATNVQNGHIIAKGLNQLVEKTAKGLGMSDQDWKNYENTSAETQLKYVEKFFKAVGKATGADGKWNSATQLYVANFAPKYVRQASNPNTVLYSKQEHSDQYEKNKGLDRDKKGHITAGDLAKSVQGKKLPDFMKEAIDRVKGSSTGIDYIGSTKKPENDNVDGLLTALFALDVGPVEKIVRNAIIRKILPTSNVLITLSSLSSPYNVRMKFANAASNLLKEMIDADVSIHSDGRKIELECSAAGSEYAVTSAVKGLCDCAVVATRSNNTSVKYAVLPSIISKYAEVK